MRPPSTRVVVQTTAGEVAGATTPGETWWQAALRLSPLGPPTVLDLSGEIKTFIVDPDLRVALRPMTPADLGDVVVWRSTPQVRRWWNDGELADADTMAEKYLQRVQGHSPTTMWVVEANGRSVGFVQDYRISDYPDYALLAPDPAAVGVDYAIGADGWRGRGLGPRMLWAWAVAAPARYPGATTLFAAPDHRNAASRRALAKAGFAEGLWFDEPQGEGRTDTVVGHTLDIATVLAAPRVGPALR